jgi:hypothetical protein
MLSYEELEGRVIVPRIYGRALRLPSSVILLSLLAGGVIAGIVGALLALPVAAAVRMIIEELRVELPGQQVQAEDVETKNATTGVKRSMSGGPKECQPSRPPPSPSRSPPNAARTNTAIRCNRGDLWIMMPESKHHTMSQRKHYEATSAQVISSCLVREWLWLSSWQSGHAVA